jgi:predicted site-specific integrase-resolvase
MRYDVSVNVKQWAECEGVHHVTAYRWFREGKLPVPARRVGRLIRVDPAAVDPVPAGVTVGYARVSSAGQRGDRDRQVARIVTGAGEQTIAVGRVVTEVRIGAERETAGVPRAAR